MQGFAWIQMSGWPWLRHTILRLLPLEVHFTLCKVGGGRVHTIYSMCVWGGLGVCLCFVLCLLLETEDSVPHNAWDIDWFKFSLFWQPISSATLKKKGSYCAEGITANINTSLSEQMFPTNQGLQQNPVHNTKGGMMFGIVINYNHNQSGRTMT